MANTDFGILLKTLLDKSGINSELEQVQKIVNKYTIDIMPELKTASLKNQMKAVSQEIANDFNKAFGTNLTGNDVFKAFENQAKQAEKAVKEEAKAIETARKEQESLTNAMAKGREQAELSRQAEQKRQQIAQNNAINKALEQEYLEREKITEAIAKGREKSEKARQTEEKRQQIAQNNAINKALEEEYKQRQKNIEVAKKQAELDRQNALAFTKSASERLSSAISKYSYGDTSDANAMMKQMNRGLSNFGDLSNVQGNITQLSSTVDKIVADLKLSHEQSLQALNQEIKAEQTLQSQKDAFNKKNINAIDYEIQKREEEAKAFSSMLQAQMQEQQKVQSEVNKIQLLSNGGVKNDYATQIAKLEGDFRSLGLAQDTITTKTQNVKNSLATLRAEFAKPVDQQNFQTIQTANDNLQRELIESRNEFEQLRASMKGMATEQQRLSLANTIEAWNQKNSGATRAVREENERYVSSLRDLSTQMTKTDFNKINTSFKQTENSMRALNKLGASFTNQMKQAMSSFTTWLSASTLVMKTISETREAIANIKELDNTLTEISKTSDMTSESLEKLGMSSYDTASKYGRTSSDYLSAFESMARSGFYDEVGKGMSELSLLAQAAGDMSQEVADNYLLATNAAYKFSGDAEKLNAVLDGMNLITNRNSVALEDMASAMSKAGTTASSYNVSVEDLSAMIGTMEAVTKSGGDEVGNSLKSILINLQNVTSSKIVGTLDKANASMTTFVNGAEKLRNPIEILRDLAKTFNELDKDDPLRAEILTNIGGKICHVA